MSSQKGNVKKSGSQKHQNAKAFKNDLHDKSKKMQNMKSLSLGGICQRCKEKIEWKIKYRKYKPLTIPRKCVSCFEKSIKQAYYTLCVPCATARGVCAKCAEKKKIVSTTELTASEQAANDSELKQELEMLPERKRRTFFRLQAQGKLCDLQNDTDEKSSDVDAAHSDVDDNDTLDQEENGSHTPVVRTNASDSKSASQSHGCDLHQSNKRNDDINMQAKNVKINERGDNSVLET
ncbi:uncharacterized protein C9orf85 homolog [Gigantopelta aegis]|uniref:uncharacterized protein C9orf85 homolog n=1 Tax=Gigantopelta aegis TaxID=1735272 RepID=UPI001B88B61F|nr:uncharacterized protein C9orf85 homolog [Gigantopelta aegis]XP_041366716.1 uncharacterized protein C9orf85 homolog [Gigantopelta aegis]